MIRYLRIALLACGALWLGSCAKEPLIAALANCESDFYSKEGTQSVDTASIDYLQRKGEHCRVCMFAKGREINTSQNYGELTSRELERLLAPKGLWNKRSVDLTPAEADVVSQANVLAFTRAKALALCTTPFWKE